MRNLLIAGAFASLLAAPFALAADTKAADAPPPAAPAAHVPTPDEAKERYCASMMGDKDMTLIRAQVAIDGQALEIASQAREIERLNKALADKTAPDKATPAAKN